jgi:aminoglycoside phosphotransferase
MDDKAFLGFLHYPDATLIGSGQESTVYDIGDGRVVKLLKAEDLNQAKREKEFYETLAAYKTSFRFPLILETGTLEGRNYLIEQKLSGMPLKDALANSSDSANRKELLKQMLSALNETRAIVFDALPYGELIAAHPLVADSWTDYFEKKVRATCEKNKQAFTAHVPDSDKFIEDYLNCAAKLCPASSVTKSLVHGDYWPPNILVEDGKVSDVIDFNDQTLVGDYRIDVASAIIFSGKMVTAEEMEYVKNIASEIFEENMPPYIDLYAKYYALLFIGLEKIDQSSYEWAFRNLFR